MITSKRSHRRADPLLLLMLFVTVGMVLTVGYQVLVDSDASLTIFARQAPPAAQVGG